MEIKAKAIKFAAEDYSETETIELTEMDIDDLRKELDAISSI